MRLSFLTIYLLTLISSITAKGGGGGTGGGTGGTGTGGTGTGGTGTGEGSSGSTGHSGTATKSIYYVQGAYMLTWMYNWDSDTYHFSTSAECPIPYCTYGYCDLSMKQEDYSLTDGSEPLCECGTV